MVIDLVEMKILLIQERLVILIGQCKQINREQRGHGSCKLIGRLGATAQAMLPTKVRVRYKQRAQIQALRVFKCYWAWFQLAMEANDEMFRWIRHSWLCNEKSLILPPPGLNITANVATKGWSATSHGTST